MTDATVESDVEETLQTVAHDRASRSVNDVVGDTGVAYIEAIRHCGLEDAPQAHRARFKHRNFLPDDVEDITESYVQQAREGDPNDIPTLLREDGLLEIKLSRGDVTFTVYEERSADKLDDIAAYCNVDDPALLVGQAVPVTREQGTYRLSLRSDRVSNNLDPDSLAAGAARGVLPFMLGILGAVAGFFVALFVGSVLASAIGALALLAGLALFVAVTLASVYGLKVLCYGVVALRALRRDGQLWPATLYASNFDGWRDYLFD